MLIKNSLRQLDLQDVMVFLTVFELGNATKASDKLGVSQSTVSYCLKRLRQGFEDDLFTPDKGTMSPTPWAAVIWPYMRSVITAINHCAEPKAELLTRSSRRNIRFSAPEYLELLALPLLSDIIMQAPIPSALHVERLGRELPAERLLAGNLDLSCGFGPGYHRLHPELDWEPLIDDTFVCLTSMRKSAGDVMSIDEFCAARHVFPTPWDSQTNMVDTWLTAIGRARTIVISATTYQTCINTLGKQSLMLSLPRRLLPLMQLPNDVYVREPPLGFPTFTLDLIWARSRHGETSWLRQKLKAAMNRL